MSRAVIAYINFVKALSRLTGVLAAVLLTVAVLTVVQMVVLRFVFNQSTTWQTEVVIYSAVAATFIGAPYVLLKRGHINVDLVTLRLNPRWKMLFHVAASLLSLAFCAVLFYYSTKWWYRAYSQQWTTETIARIPLWIPWLSLPVGMGGLVLQYLADLLELAVGSRLDQGENVYGAGSSEPVGERA